MLYIKDGKLYQGSVVLGDMRIINPSEEQILQAGYTEYIPETVEPYVPTYEEQVITLIRGRYSVDQELAILRQQTNKSQEYDEYYAYCEECKDKMKEILV